MTLPVLYSDTSTEELSGELLEWNQRKALSHLLAMEEHLSELSPEERVHSWCTVKSYLLVLDHHVYEAIGHAERAGKDSEPYRRFRQDLEDLNVYPEPHIGIKDVVNLRTKWRMLIKDPTLTDDCPTCSLDVVDTPELISYLRKRLNIDSSPNTKQFTYVGERKKLAKNDLTDVGINAVVGLVAGSVGAAVHFMFIKPQFDAQNILGLKGSVVVDVVLGIVSIAIATIMDVPDFLKGMLMILGGTLMGLGVAHAAGINPTVSGVGSPMIPPPQIPQYQITPVML